MALTVAERKKRYWARHKDDPEFRRREAAHVLRWRISKRDDPEYRKKRQEDRKRFLSSPDNRAKQVQWVRKWQIANRDKTRAQHTLQYAVKTGKVIPPLKCPECGLSPDKGRLQAHHNDYSRPLDVTWLCQPCHAKTWRKHES